MLLSLLFFGEKKRKKNHLAKQGGFKKKVGWRHPFKKRGWGFKERQHLIETCLKKNNVFVAEYHLQENILKDTLLKRWGTDQLSLGCMNFTPIPAAICEKKCSNSTNLQISQNEKKSS